MRISSVASSAAPSTSWICEQQKRRMRVDIGKCEGIMYCDWYRKNINHANGTTLWRNFQALSVADTRAMTSYDEEHNVAVWFVMQKLNFASCATHSTQLVVCYFTFTEKIYHILLLWGTSQDIECDERIQQLHFFSTYARFSFLFQFFSPYFSLIAFTFSVL